MATRAIDLRRGMGVKYKDGIWVVFNVDHVVKGKGKSLMQIELKNIETGRILRERFNVNDRVEVPFFERRKMEYLYSDANNHILMDENYEQVLIPVDLIGEKSVYLTENLPLEVSYVDGQPLSVEIPNTVDLKVVDTIPQVKGATATSQNKDALCQGGAKIKVPPFVENGTMVKVDTRTGEYLSRA
jgi:elongation factor P